MQLSQAVELFLNDQKPTTRQSYQYVLRALMNYLGPARPLIAIRPADLIEYQHYLGTKNYAPATLNKHVKTIKTLFNWLVKIEELEKTPARALKSKRQGMYITRDKAMTDDELARLLEHAYNHPKKSLLYRTRDYALILFLADTGCRIGGAAGLKLTDLDLELGKAEVTEKGDKTRPVKYGKLCAVSIAKLLLLRPHTAGDYVFSLQKIPMHADNISLMMRRMCKQIGIRVLSGHSLRHRKGHQFADERIAPTIAATALGHSNANITLQHYYPADWDTAERALDHFAVTPELRPAEEKPVINLADFIRKASST